MPDAQQKAKKAWGNVKSNVKSGTYSSAGGSKKASWDRLTPVRELLAHLGESALLAKKWSAPPINISTLGDLVQAWPAQRL